MTKLLHADMTSQIIGVYYTVYNRLSQTYPEYIFEKAMVLLLRQLGIECFRQDEYEIRYKDKRVGLQRLDIFVAGTICDRDQGGRMYQPNPSCPVAVVPQSSRPGSWAAFRFGGPKPEYHAQGVDASSVAGVHGDAFRGSRQSLGPSLSRVDG